MIQEKRLTLGSIVLHQRSGIHIHVTPYLIMALAIHQALQMLESQKMQGLKSSVASDMVFINETSQELRMLSRSLSDCKSLLLNVMIQVGGIDK